MMRTVNEVSKMTGVSIRTLQYYDKIGLLHPAERTESNYRLYDDAALEELEQILMFRELEFSLKDIKDIVSGPNFDREKALDQQIALLTLKREHIDNLLTFARGIKPTGGKTMDFSAFDTKKMDDYAKKAKAQWGDTEAYREYSDKSKGRSKEYEQGIAKGLMSIFEEFGRIKETKPDSKESKALVKKLKSYISQNYYNCTNEILMSLGMMYAAGGEFTDNIDEAGGEGTARFASDAIASYVDGEK